jgi:membrane protease YdiL (CAAX protease family)
MDSNPQNILTPDVAAPAEELSVPRFCNRCGAPRSADMAQCACFVAPESSEGAAWREDESFRQDQRAVRSAVWLYFALLSISAAVIVWIKASDSEPSATVEFVTSAAFSMVVLAWCAIAWKQVFPPIKAAVHPGWILAGMMAGVPTYLLAHGVVEMLFMLGVDKVDYLSVLYNNGFGFGWAVLLVCVQPAVFEELAFRGIIQGSLDSVLGVRQSLFVTALMFGILHLSFVSLPHLFVMGLALGWLRMRTGSLLPGMALHFCHNFFAIAQETNGGILPW